MKTEEVAWQNTKKINISVCVFQVTREYTVKQVSIFILPTLSRVHGLFLISY